MPQDIFASGGECGELLRSFDWDRHPLGPLQAWPVELRTVTQMVLGAQFPMFVVWGPEQYVLYNDACAGVYGPAHPAAMGRRFRDTLGPLWEQVGPLVARAYQGQASSGVDAPFTMWRAGYPERTHVSFCCSPVRMAGGDVAGMFCVFHETTSRVAVEREREREQGLLRSIFETALGAVAVTSGPNHYITYVNEEFEAISGYRNALGKTVREAFPDVAGQGYFEMLDRVFAEGGPQTGRAMPAILQADPDSPPLERVVDILCHPVFARDGATEGVFVQILDVTDSHLLNRELAHRLKNQLAVVQAIINQSFRGASDLAGAHAALTERIAVLARAHEAAFAGQENGVGLRSLIRAAVEWHDAARIGMTGPDVAIAARPALSLALILHELLTNAVKHGALSAGEGRVDISWEARAPEPGAMQRLRLLWEERGGPPVREPQRRGSGLRLVQAGLSGAPRVQVRVAFPPEGLRCVLEGELPPPG
ncbi:HWE histidine kinase domain-containing protein [Camelimonas abortus]|uniref:histidine kinase n=1 Tax=Camelimonas abortus TaxID=1017184 RepID=A0ABV7LAE5_9HYPH